MCAFSEPAEWPAWKMIPDGRFGIAHGGVAVSPRVPMHDFYLMEDAGITWTRVTPEQILHLWGVTKLGNLPWTPWSRLDNFLAEAQEHGVNVLMLLSEPMGQEKAKDGKVVSTYLPPEGEALEKHVRFVRELAARCKGKVQVWEFFNEMNLHDYRLGFPNVDQYLAWLKPTYAAIKEIDPEARLTTGGFGYRPVPYLREMMEKGAGAYFDILNVHYYPNKPEEMFLEWVEELRDILREYGTNKPVWITEIGWTTAEGCTSEADHGDYMSRATVMCQASNVAVMFPHLMGCYGLDPKDHEFNFGLLRVDDSPKPAWTTYKATIQQIWGKEFGGDVLGEFGDVRGYLFERGAERTVALWALYGDEEVALPIDTPSVKLATAYNKPLFPTIQDGQLRLTLSKTPVFLTGSPLEELRRRACVRVTAPVGAALPGTPLDVYCSVASNTLKRQEVTVHAEAFPDGLVEPAETKALVGYAPQKMAFTLTPAETSEGQLAVSVRFTVQYADGAKVEREFRRFMPYPWIICGPFPNPEGEVKEPVDGTGLDTDYLGEHGGESSIRPRIDMAHAGSLTPDGKAVWRKAGKFRGERLDFEREFEQNRLGVAYAFVNIRRQESGPVKFVLGSNDGVKVWINHKLVHHNHRHRNSERETDVFTINLKKGDNPCLVKVEQAGGMWDFYLHPWRKGDPEASMRGGLQVAAPFHVAP
jgi:hypothetical protein